MAHRGGCTLRAGVASSDGSITVSPGIPLYVTARAKQLGLPTRSAYITILLHNYLNGPLQLLPVVESPGRVVKVRMQVAMSRALRVAATKAARRWDLSLSKLVEALVICDADNGRDELIIWLARGTEKPELD